MGKVISMLKQSAASSMSQIKGMDIGSTISSYASNVELPKMDLPKLDVKFSDKDLKMPLNLDNYIPKGLAESVMPQVKLPSEINGVKLPELPDLSSVTSKVEGTLNSIGFDTNALGIRSISDILKAPDMSGIKDVIWDSPVDLDNMPDLTKSLDGFNVDSIQNEVNSITSQVPGAHIDLSKYF